MSFSERLKIAMQATGHTQGSLARAVGMAQSSVWRLTSGGASGTKKLFKIAKVLGVNPEWLSDGIGEMRANYNNNDYQFFSDTVSLYDKKETISSDVFAIKIYNRMEWVLSPGKDGEKDFNPMFWLPRNIPSKTNNSLDFSVAIIAPDDSMSPHINEGSIVILDRSVKDVRNGKTYAVSYGGVYMLRTLYQLPEGKVRLKNNKPDDYPEGIISISDLTIIGKVYYAAGIFD
ncbi:MAG: LexA family transcriptional regulator [Sodalis sp. (in: enterobacteria)]|uniref:LexA family transcriptional regulator n=1 Tax=Sodalis sp. (in: enterobacteria) TaxID=1898979 RepID=UPI003F35CC87